ncbi:MAG: DUF2259 domain-containing protein [Termitinemataceae bacterium]|nr:MAG: DUF2259 domain-containing protein [Termitinemataceae bacterium]
MLGTSICLWAGDVASFADLGFAQNSNIYLFGQYGVYENTLKPWADLSIVDVGANDFVSGGRFSYTHDEKILPGQDGQGALIKLISKNSQTVKQYKANFLQQGIPLYISLKNGQNPNGEAIDFRDFDFGRYYTASLVPAVFGSGKNVRSSFYIIMNSTRPGGIKKTYRVGSPDIKRNGISSYTIKKVVVSEDRRSMIFVIEMTVLNGDGPDIRYMVEAVKL